MPLLWLCSSFTHICSDFLQHTSKALPAPLWNMLQHLQTWPLGRLVPVLCSALLVHVELSREHVLDTYSHSKSARISLMLIAMHAPLIHAEVDCCQRCTNRPFGLLQGEDVGSPATVCTNVAWGSVRRPRALETIRQHVLGFATNNGRLQRGTYSRFYIALDV